MQYSNDEKYDYITSNLNYLKNVAKILYNDNDDDNLDIIFNLLRSFEDTDEFDDIYESAQIGNIGDWTDL